MDELFVCKSSMVTPVGLGTVMTAAVIKAGHSAYKASAYFGLNHQPMTMADVPDDALPELVEVLQYTAKLSLRQKRMIQLAAPSLCDVLNDQTELENIPCFIAGSETLPHLSLGMSDLFIDALILQTGLSIDKAHSKVFAMGRAGGFHAIDAAFKFMKETGRSFALVGGVDTYKDSMLLAKLDREARILSYGAAEGFAPGEASSFILLTNQKTSDSHTRIFSPGFAEEDGHLYSQNPYRGDGLAIAFKQALECEANTNINKVYSSMNGEHFFAKEYGVAVVRNNHAFSPVFTVEHPADCFGDIGAAFGPTAIALISQQKPGNYLAYGSSDGAHRAAICIQQMPH